MSRHSVSVRAQLCHWLFSWLRFAFGSAVLGESELLFYVFIFFMVIVFFIVIVFFMVIVFFIYVYIFFMYVFL